MKPLDRGSLLILAVFVGIIFLLLSARLDIAIIVSLALGGALALKWHFSGRLYESEDPLDPTLRAD